MQCNLCPRFCNIDRSERTGFCNVGKDSFVARSALHMWEEPFLSGKNGSGTVFFCGCNMRCIFCQNSEISTELQCEGAVMVDASILCNMMLRLQDMGAHNINLVTPTPHIRLIAQAIKAARKSNLNIPIAYNTNSYVTVEGLKMLDGLIDIYMPDLKYVSSKLAKTISGAESYPEYAQAAIAEMFRQCGNIMLDDDNIAKCGVVIRHLVLPGNVDETRRVLDYISDNYPSDIYVSLMSQYFPAYKACSLPPFDRKLLKREYDRAVEYALSKGFTNVFTQKMAAADKAYVPKWGVISS